MKEMPKVFRPSRALIPFAVFFLVLVVVITGRIFASSPILVGILLLPFSLFAVWWFATLLMYALQFWVAVSPDGLEVNRPAGGFFDTESILMTWDELKDVEFLVKDEFSPKSFTGREAELVLHVKEGKAINIPHIMVLEQYTNLFAFIQQRLPFVYELPEEQLWDPKLRIAITGGIALIFIILLFIFI